jgi:formylglycine-generating enzyme required for sulfatase activity
MFDDMVMVRVHTDDGDFCIDQTEVTRGQFDRFVKSNPDLSTLYESSACSLVTDVRPFAYPFPAGTGAFPVGGVGYCGAEAYCAYAGKTLCGAINGDALAVALFNNPRYDAWMRACGGESGLTYPYGDSYDADACNTERSGGHAPTPVGLFAECASPDGVYDLSGNVWEWVRACTQDVNTSDPCYVRGGASTSSATDDEFACNHAPRTSPRADKTADIGFSCCTP